MLKIQSAVRLLVLTTSCLALTFAGTIQAQQRKAHPAPWVGKDFRGVKCTGVQYPFGPHDYLNRHRLKSELAVVEDHHFDAQVEQLIRGITSTPMDDINYTLSTWPNHHRALNSAINFRLKHRKWPRDSKGKPAECYLQRAIKFSPKDGVSHMLYGLLQHRFKRYPGALESYGNAYRLMPDDVVVRYNTGLVLTDMKKFKDASVVAEDVYGLGFPLPGLRNKLVKAGWWDPQTEEPIVPKKAAKKNANKKKRAKAKAGGATVEQAGPDATPPAQASAGDTQEPGPDPEIPPGETPTTTNEAPTDTATETTPVAEPGESGAADERVEPAITTQ